MQEGVGDCIDTGRLDRLLGMIERLVGELATVDVDVAAAKRVEVLTRDALAEIGGLVADARCAPGTIDALRIVEARLLAWQRAPTRAAGVIDLRPEPAGDERRAPGATAPAPSHR